MALSYGFYNAFDHDRKYNAVQFSRIFDGIITDGIYATYMEAMQVKASENANEVVVGPGRAWFLGTWSYNDADLPVAAPDPEVVLDRIDTLVLDVNTEQAARANSYIWVQGTPTSQTPVAPTLINTDTHKQYPLCDVYRQAGTTQIYTENITNRRGTSDCPFVTGVLETINVDNLLAQWDAEFHTWENATKVSFEGWMLNQQTVYTAWWDALKDQMSDDVQDVEDWIETIRGIIDSETATHLQLEIDEINEMLPAGSHITVTTLNSELFSRSVTITDEDNHTVTTQFNSSGVAVFKTVPYVGNLTITSTDGTRTATAVVNTPYFARYAFNLAFWSATVNLNGDSELGGVTVTVKDSDNTTVTAIVLNASGDGVFSATYPDTYKFIYTYGGQTMEVSLAVTQETTYNVTIHGGFNYSGWLTAGRVSGTYADLDAVLADEEAIRQLMLVHDAVDYLASANVNADVEKIFNNDLCAKWINLSDYALDTFYTVSDIKTVMDTADKYGYGEWALIYKAEVPTMTSNTAPSGTAACSSERSDHKAYLAFDGNDSTSAATNNNVPIGLFSYHSASSFVVKRFKIRHATQNLLRITLKGSNDGTTWIPIATFDSDLPASGVDKYYDVSENNTAYSYHGVELERTAPVSADTICWVNTIQFYSGGWQPKGNVPIMTSNTAPYGEAIGTQNSGNENYKAFNGNDSVYTASASSTGWTGYKFTSPVCVKRVSFIPYSGRLKTYTIDASNDGGSTWIPLTDVLTCPNDGNKQTVELNNNDFYLMYRINCTSTWSGNYVLYTLQFYGRELSVSVPVMTSNTAPYGEAFASSVYSSSYNACKAFDRNDALNDLWASAGNNSYTNEYIGYDFGRKVNIKQVKWTNRTVEVPEQNDQVMPPKNYKIQGYDGSSWVDITDTITNTNTTSGHLSSIDIASSAAYSKIRMFVIDINDTGSPTKYVAIGTLQFYGLDYSEKEFEEGSTKKWLYDHGVYLEEMETCLGSNGGSLEDRDYEIVTHGGSTDSYNNFAFKVTKNTIDITDYNYFMGKYGDRIVGYATSGSYYGQHGGIVLTTIKPSGTYSGSNFISDINSPVPLSGLQTGGDVSAVNQSLYAMFGEGYWANLYSSFKELWLE